ncbi:MAG TPA: hypothetical protein VM261_38315 [Kofleriaceae bacterium]|nr:hypothetical protein [Kofleriaceae bacterium]
MRGSIVGFTLAAGVAGAAASAAAQPSTAPAQPETDVYPAEHTDRPLLLPAAALEGTALLEIFDADYEDAGGVGYEAYTLRPAARYGLAGAEVEGGLTLALHESDGYGAGTDALRSVDFAGRFGVGASATAGVEVSMGNPTTDFASYGAAATLATKQRFGAASLELGAAAGYTHVASEGALDTINLRGRIAATAQLARTFALQGRGELYWLDYTGSDQTMSPSFGWYLGQRYGVAALFAASPTLDVIAGFDMLSTGDATVRLFTLGVAARRVP